MKIRAFVAAGAVASSMALAPVTAHADTVVPAPTPAGAILVTPGQEVVTHAALSDGTVETITVDAGVATKAPWPAGFAHPLSSTSGCWIVVSSIRYGLPGTYATFKQTVNWCGNPTTHRMIGMASQTIDGNVQAGGQALGWSYLGVMQQQIIPYYNSDGSQYANQAYAEGRFQQCAVFKLGCPDNKYPHTWTNVYPDGAVNFYTQS